MRLETSPVLEVNKLSKTFNSFQAVKEVTFELYRGEILGLLGPNGAGKTTIIHMLLGLTLPTSGEIRIFGLNPEKSRQREKILSRMNFSSTYVAMPLSLTVRESLMVFGQLYGVKKAKKKIETLIEQFDLKESANKAVRTLSSGQMTRLNLAKAFINDPEILLLDEPTASLDPDIADRTRNYLIEIKKTKNMAIIYTSHNMNEMEVISDRLLFLHHGEIIARGTPAEVVRQFSGENLEEVFLKIAREMEP
ncbi:MAG TPA: ABC transporter ATP-binding protein [Candidatus Saccharicenans sp.]|jgi:ABC-2 type transport system ATP-binding protein|nr:ABC transporter ATP-binding protein [Candidatus Saccharicenans sp.]HRD02175.1 ABC transporter ATP-binding protein [Candidatus Saccharicenans sp.]